MSSLNTASSAEAQPREQNPQLNGLRALAMGLVFLGHFAGYYVTHINRPGELAGFLAHLNDAQYGSFTFLMITGFVIQARVQSDRNFRWKPYLRARFLRIIPLFWFTLAVKASVETIAGKHDRLPSNAAEAAAYLAQNAFLIFPFIGVRAYITVSWTLSYICLGYLIIPALIQLCRKRGWNGGARMILAWLLLLFFVFVPMATPRIGWNGAGLALGMMVYELNQSRRLIRRVGWLDLFTLFAFAAGCGFFNLLSLLPPSGHTNAMRFVALFASLAPVMMLFTGRIAPGGWLNQALAGPLFNRFAFISYAFYLMHGLTWIVFGWIGMHRMTEGGGGFISLLLLALAVAVGIASLVHRYVEPRLEELVSFALHFLYSQTASRLQLTRFLNRPVLSRVP